MKRKTFLLLALLFVAGCCFASANGKSRDMKQRLVIDISGRWQSSLGECTLPGTTDENKLGDGNHPTDVTSQLTRLYPYEGVVLYERDVEITKQMEGCALTLELERTKPSVLWIDGDSIGSRKSLFAPHVYELPQLSAGVHHVKIAVDNRREAVPSGVHGSHAWSDATQTNWNGVIGRMQIVAKPQAHIDGVRVRADIDMNEVVVKVDIAACKPGKYMLRVERSATDGEDETAVIEGEVEIKRGLERTPVEVLLTMDMGESPKLWSEFHPDTYELTATLTDKKGKSADMARTTFGMSRLSVEGNRFVMNGNKTFLRGTHDACVFPLTAYCPADVESWRRLFRIAKQYGINHYRFHSYTPTEAAFTAADEEGVYLHAELPMWGTIDRSTQDINTLLRDEAFAIIDSFGNHPSFVSMGLGNELWGDNVMMAQWLDEFRHYDFGHRLYSQGSNNDLGWRGPKWVRRSMLPFTADTPEEGGRYAEYGDSVPGEDFYITCRVGGGEGFSTHTRTSFSFADADGGGILNSCRPTTDADFSKAVAMSPIPIVSHESCQFQIYPDYSEIPKYTGVLHPYNLEVFRSRLEENGLTRQIADFHDATGRWAVDCYKADMEYCLRTPGFGGFQLLDIKDYPGQGSALCGILDAFMDSKGIVEADDFKGWNDAVVPMARMADYCLSTADTLKAEIVVSNYTEDDYRRPLAWRLFGVNSRGEANGMLTKSGEIDFLEVPQGEVAAVGMIEVPLAEVDGTTQLRLELATGDYHNYYNIWVYAPSAKDAAYKNLICSDTIDAAVEKALAAGRRVLLMPRNDSYEKQSVGGLFTPDYWNYAMFKTISENNDKPVSPGTLGMLMDKEHPLFSKFPTEGRSDWQWWSVALNSRPLILNSLAKDYLPIIQTVDNVERNHKLGILMEFKVGKGRLLISTTDMAAISKYVEGKAYADAVMNYASGEDFNPNTEISIDELRNLLYSETTIRNIQGVENLTNYKKEK